jgi:cytochrome c-type biogenesis protein
MIDALTSWTLQIYELLTSATQLSPSVYLLVLAGGIASALSPCYVPVLAMFAGYVGGYARERTAGGLRMALPFVLGNALPLALVGGLAVLLGRSVLQIFTGYQLDRWIPGVVGLIMGLQLLGILKLRMPQVITVRSAQRPDSGWGSFSLGLLFSLVVTPCTIPIFFAIVSFVAFQASALHGALLMVAYAFGRGVILLVVALSAGSLKALNSGRTARYIERSSGALILVASLGLLLFYEPFVRFTGQWMVTGHSGH